MPNSTSIAAYPDCKQRLEEALASERGIRLKFESSAMATRFKHRCNSMRKLDRKLNMTLYPQGHSMHGTSIYDILAIIQETDTRNIRIEKITSENVNVEPL